MQRTEANFGSCECKGNGGTGLEKYVETFFYDTYVYSYHLPDSGTFFRFLYSSVILPFRVSGPLRPTFVNGVESLPSLILHNILCYVPQSALQPSHSTFFNPQVLSILHFFQPTIETGICDFKYPIAMPVKWTPETDQIVRTHSLLSYSSWRYLSKLSKSQLTF